MITTFCSLYPCRQKHQRPQRGFFHLFMALQHRRCDECLLAQVTLVLFVAVMNHLDVHVERVLPLEGGVALVALERPLACRHDNRETQPFAVICCRYLKHTVITRSKLTTNFPSGINVQTESAKRNVSLHRDNPTKCSCLGFLFFLLLCTWSQHLRGIIKTPVAYD